MIFLKNLKVKENDFFLKELKKMTSVFFFRK